MLGRLMRPSEYMARLGCHPHESHQIDVPKAVADLAKRAERLAVEVANAFDEDATTDWREHSKQLAGRIAAQRREIDRLHKKVRELRADVHERDELLGDA